jgi:hypothetical protein
VKLGLLKRKAGAMYAEAELRNPSNYTLDTPASSSGVVCPASGVPAQTSHAIAAAPCQRLTTRATL